MTTIKMDENTVHTKVCCSVCKHTVNMIGVPAFVRYIPGQVCRVCGSPDLYISAGDMNLALTQGRACQ